MQYNTLKFAMFRGAERALHRMRSPERHEVERIKDPAASRKKKKLVVEAASVAVAMQHSWPTSTSSSFSMICRGLSHITDSGDPIRGLGFRH